VQVFVNSLRDIVRASDGKFLYREPDRAGGKPRWTPPVIVGDKIYLSRYGPQNLLVLDFIGATGDAWDATRLQFQAPTVSILPTPPILRRGPSNFVHKG
jgi:hypothetical protein